MMKEHTDKQASAPLISSFGELEVGTRFICYVHYNVCLRGTQKFHENKIRVHDTVLSWIYVST